MWLDIGRTLHRPGEVVRCRIAARIQDAPVLVLAWNESGEFVFSRDLRLKNGRAEVEIPYDKRFGRRLSVGAAAVASNAIAARTVIFPGSDCVPPSG